MLASIHSAVQDLNTYCERTLAIVDALERGWALFSLEVETNTVSCVGLGLVVLTSLTY